MTPRGIRNNNPGNIRQVPGVMWLGECGQQNDETFVQFTAPVYGIRAIVRIMRSYERRGIQTLEEAIDRWAPPNENNSWAYVEAVCSACNIPPSAPVSLGTIMVPLVEAIILHENGEQPYTQEQIQQGIELA